MFVGECRWSICKTWTADKICVFFGGSVCNLESSWYGKGKVANIDILGAKDKVLWQTCREFCGIIGFILNRAVAVKAQWWEGGIQYIYIYYMYMFFNNYIYIYICTYIHKVSIMIDAFHCQQLDCIPALMLSSDCWLQLVQGITTSTCMKQWLISADLCTSVIGYINITVSNEAFSVVSFCNILDLRWDFYKGLYSIII